MKSDNGHLQRLTDDQVSRRLAAFADDGRFQESMRWLWDQAGDLIEDASRNHFGEDAASQNRDQFTKPVNEAWVRAVAEEGVRMYVAKADVPNFVAARASMARDVVAALDGRFASR